MRGNCVFLCNSYFIESVLVRWLIFVISAFLQDLEYRCFNMALTLCCYLPVCILHVLFSLDNNNII